METKDYYDIDDYAGFWLRLAAYLIDAIALSIVFYLITFIFMGSAILGSGMTLGAEEPSPEELLSLAGAGGTSMIIGIVLFWLYFAFMESSKNQATLGKMAVGIKVTDMNGDRISFGRATGRYFGKIISGLIIYIGFIMAAFTEKRQALHDMMVNTLVVRKNVPPLR